MTSRRLTLLPLAAVTAFAVAACEPTGSSVNVVTTEFVDSAAFSQVVTEEEFRLTHVGNCIFFKGSSSGKQCFDSVGSTYIADQVRGTDTGTWTTRDGQVCFMWSKQEAEVCETYMTDGEGNYFSGGRTWSLSS